ncbi:glutamine-hydrolyzing carbamoyl-phosphate synthase small subunit [Halobacteriovorax marinus]|uniref:glutamine-hydrolyzing carbamoyl-phosphate synthase small subunit n=1 Tax=Halobacteriovorax marinus TaxID=97084 RepID=UPI003A922229
MGKLYLSNERQFCGNSAGAKVNASGELVFTTSMVGYHETLTDPSYYGQIIVFSYPLIGNYGVPKFTKDTLLEGFESKKIHASGVILSSASTNHFHSNSFASLSEWLTEQGVPLLTEVDTRELTKMIRQEGCVFGNIIVNEGVTIERPSLYSHTEDKFFNPSLHCLMSEVSTDEIVHFGDSGPVVGVIDCGIKWNIIRKLLGLKCQVKLIPWNADLDNIDCDAWLISNGPGDPTKSVGLVERISTLIKRRKPVFGICLGHQLLSMAFGAEVRRLPYGHRSYNQPVQLVNTNKGFLTSQNHGYYVDEKTLPPFLEPWFINANDKTLEGVKHQELPIYSVQFHPEAAGGPQETSWIFDKFVSDIKESVSEVAHAIT